LLTIAAINLCTNFECLAIPKIQKADQKVKNILGENFEQLQVNRIRPQIPLVIEND